MRTVMIFFALLFLGLVAGIIILYLYFEIPKQNELKELSTVVNFSIYATGQDNGEYIKTNYEVKVDGELFSTGETMLDVPVVVSIPTNRTVSIYNRNKENQEYYTSLYTKTVVGEMEAQRVELKLSKPGNIIFLSDVRLDDTGKLIVSVKSDSYFRNPYLCFKWSSHLITVSTVYKEVPKLERYQLYDKCYNFDREIGNESFSFPVKYKVFGDLNDNDYIKMAFIDTDCSDVCSTYLIDSNNQTIDVGARDIIYIVTNKKTYFE